jgi:hypothetical protein
MKHLFTLAIGIMICFNSFEQTAESNEYYDAIRLKSYINSRGNFASNGVDDKYYDILLKYSPQLKNETEDSLKSYYKNTNTFLSGYINPTVGMSPANLSSRATSFSGFANIGGTDITMYADVMAKFMIERAKAELTIAFFDRFQKFVEENPDVKTLFPKTCSRLLKIQATHYKQVLDVLRTAFKEDLEALPEHLIDVVENYSETNSLPELMLVTRTIKQVKKLEYLSAAEFINQLPEITSNVSSIDEQWYKNLDASLKLTAILSNSIRDNSGNRNWISSKEFYDNILKDPVATNIYLGLIYEKIKKEKITINGTLLSDSIKNNQKELDWFKSELSELINLTEKIEHSIEEIKETEGAATYSQIHSYISTTLDVTEYGYGIFEHFAKKGGEVRGDFQEYLGMVKSANEVYRYVYEKDYGSAVMETVDLLKTIYNRPTDTKIDNLTDALASVKNMSSISIENGVGKIQDKNELTENQTTVLTSQIAKTNEKFKGKESKTSVDEYKKELISKIEKKINCAEKDRMDYPWLDKLVTFGIFMANMVEADSSEQVMDILESFALPVGSSTLRRNSNLSVNLTSYLGASLNVNNSSIALTAPIGVDVGWGLRKGGSFSLNASLLDIGAIVDYRLSNDSSAIETKITLGNIFSPGASLIYGFPFGIPLAVSFGGQYGPGLTSISHENIPATSQPGWTWRASLFVDMPLFNFYNAPKKKL